jgi:hypothetical protein
MSGAQSKDERLNWFWRLYWWHEPDPYKFSIRGLLFDMFHARWEFGWDTRQPLPSWGGAIALYYDGMHYGLRVWRFYVALD